MTVRRSISTSQRVKVFLAANGVCHICGGKIVGKKWDVEHRIPLALGGADDESNWAPAHRDCHAGKSKVDIARIAKAKRNQARHLGAYRSSNPIPGSRNTPWRKRMNGTTERRT